MLHLHGINLHGAWHRMLQYMSMCRCAMARRLSHVALPQTHNHNNSSVDNSSSSGIWCSNCQKRIHASTQWDDHKIGKRHRKNIGQPQERQQDQEQPSREQIQQWQQHQEALRQQQQQQQRLCTVL